MELKINIEKMHAYSIMAILVIGFGMMGVYATGGTDPNVMGHSAGELDLSGGVEGNTVFNGNVEIGTSSNKGLILTSTAEDNFQLKTWTDSPNPNFNIAMGNGAGGISKNWISAQGASGDLFLCQDGGNVGIGTTAPSQKLDVAGYVKGQSGLCIGNDCKTSWPGASSFSCTTKTASKSAGGAQTSAPSLSVSCDSGYTMTGGGCDFSNDNIRALDYPSGNGWLCKTKLGSYQYTSMTTYVRCCRSV